jgi:glycosyltransferase involved in cell wall biosynthesis
MYDLSVIVPTHNRRGYLPALLTSLAAQAHPGDRWELILVDDGSTDDTQAYLATTRDPRPAHTTVLHQAQSGPAAARNTGVARAQGRAVLFLDDDMIAGPGLIAEHVAGQAAEPNAVVVGHLTVPKGGRDPWVAWEDAALARHYADLDSGRRVPGPRDFFSGNCSVATDLFRRVGGYNTTLARTEDLELGYRLADAGARFAYRAAADSLHLGHHRFDAWLRNARIYGRADVLLGWEHGHTELQTEIFRWFRHRNRLNRTLVQLCGPAPFLEPPLIRLIDGLGRASYRLGARRVAHAAYSAIYNLAYWQALSAALGRTRFWQGVRGTPPGPAPAAQPTTGTH